MWSPNAINTEIKSVLLVSPLLRHVENAFFPKVSQRGLTLDPCATIVLSVSCFTQGAQLQLHVFLFIMTFYYDSSHDCTLLAPELLGGVGTTQPRLLHHSDTV